MRYPEEYPGMSVLGWYGMIDTIVIANILNSMSDSVIVIGEDGEVLYANRVTQDILGYTLEDLKAQGIGLLFFENEDNYQFNQIFSDAVMKKSVNDYREVDYHHPDGSIRRLAATSSYLLAVGEHETEFVGFVAVFKDITQVFNLQRKEQELLKERERIGLEKIRSLQKLAMGVAHEIRNPVVTIGGFAKRIVRDKRNPEETIRYAESMVEEVDKLETLVNEVQQYCDIPEMRLSKGNLALVVEGAIDEAMAQAQDRHVMIEMRDLCGGASTVFDPDLIKRAVRIMLDNALDFSPDGSTIQVSVHRMESGCAIAVKDSGRGIKPHDMEFLFHPFFSTRAEGLGMGLAILERIAHEHMGRIEVDSEPGKGSTFTLIIPDLAM